MSARGVLKEYAVSRTEIYNNFFSAKALFVSGLLIMPALLFNPVTELRIIQFLFFWLLAILAGKKINFIFTIIVTLFIIAFNLIIPYGKVLFSIGIFKITSGALEAGIHRAVTLQALVMLSKAIVRQDLKLHGGFGIILSESLRIFSTLTGRKYNFFRSAGRREGIIASIDSVMIEISSAAERPESGEPSADNVHITKTKPAGFVILAAVIILSWLPWITFIS